MSRLFASASSQYLQVDVGILTVYPITMACWFRSNDVTANHGLMWLGDKDVAAHYHALEINAGFDDVIASSRAGGGPVEAISSTSYTANTWHHACAVFTSATDRAAFLDGAGKGTNATDITPAGIDRFAIGRFADSSPVNYMDGRIAECAIWNVGLSDQEVSNLATGRVPAFRIRPDALKGYWPIGLGSPETDLSGALNNLTVTGATVADHVPLGPLFGFDTGYGALAAAADGPPMRSLLGVGRDCSLPIIGLEWLRRRKNRIRRQYAKPSGGPGDRII